MRWARSGDRALTVVDEHSVGRVFHFEGVQRLCARRTCTRVRTLVGATCWTCMPRLLRTALAVHFGKEGCGKDHVFQRHIVSSHLQCPGAVRVRHWNQRAGNPRTRLVCARKAQSGSNNLGPKGGAQATRQARNHATEGVRDSQLALSSGLK